MSTSVMAYRAKDAKGESGDKAVVTARVMP